MEKQKICYTGLATILICFSAGSHAQETPKSKFTAGTDLCSSYLFRGTRFGHGPSVQPSVKYIGDVFKAGVWGSFDASGYAETDPYLSFVFPSGFNLGLTDYYYPGLELFDVSQETGSQALEINTGFTRGGLSLGANYIINAAGGAGSEGGDMYFQATYSFTNVSLFAGSGTGWHTIDGKFDICNAGISATREIRISESFSVPVIGQVIINPDREQLFVVVGFSF